MKAQYGSKKKYHYLYKTTNLINGKFYYGMHSTDNLEDGYKGSGTLLRRSIKKYGIDNFVIEILEFFDTREALAEAEMKLVTEVQVKDLNCMNLKPGGSGGLVDKAHADKWHVAGGRASIGVVRNIHLQKLQTDPEYVEKWRSSMRGRRGSFLGKKHKPETIEKMKQHRGKGSSEGNSQFGTKWITNERENKKIKATDQIPEGWRAGRKIK
jgi:group I intron endonuclease